MAQLHHSVEPVSFASQPKTTDCTWQKETVKTNLFSVYYLLRNVEPVRGWRYSFFVLYQFCRWCNFKFVSIFPSVSNSTCSGSDSWRAVWIKTLSKAGVNVESLNADWSNRLRTSAHNDVLPPALHLITCHVLDGTLWYLAEVTVLHNVPLIAEVMQSSIAFLPFKLFSDWALYLVSGLIPAFLQSHSADSWFFSVQFSGCCLTKPCCNEEK